MKIEFNRLDLQYKKYKREINKAAIRVLNSNQYILGQELVNFETQFSKYLGIKETIGVNSGTDALILALRALGIGSGDDVIVPANTYIATVIAVTENGANPIFVEPNEFYLIDPKLIEKAITPKTKAIIPVHLYGQSCDMDPINAIAKKHDLYVIEDCAQSHGATYKGKKTGTLGNVGCFSFYPTKNLGAIGDGGAITTNDKKIADRLRMMRNFGSKKKYHHEIEGINSRLDEIQAAFLSVKLKHLDKMNKERRKIAEYYLDNISNEKIFLPKTNNHNFHVFHLFVIRVEKREKFIRHLNKNNIGYSIHYPIPPYNEIRYEYLRYNNENTNRLVESIISLPLYVGVNLKELKKIVAVINKF